MGLGVLDKKTELFFKSKRNNLAHLEILQNDLGIYSVLLGKMSQDTVTSGKQPPSLLKNKLQEAE